MKAARSAREMVRPQGTLPVVAVRQRPVRGPFVSVGGRTIVQVWPLRMISASMSIMSAKGCLSTRFTIGFATSLVRRGR